MNIRRTFPGAAAAAMALLAGPLASYAQVPVDEDGNVIGAVATAPSEAAIAQDPAPLRTAAELEALVGPVALYPDDLLAVVLPAATYPLQVVQAARFLEKLENDPSLKPDEDWDDSVVALVNYPEVVEMMNEDLDWTWQLGEAVVAQQADVISAIATFRNKAHAAGNLKSDDRQTVSRNDDDIIEIAPVSEEVIYVPYYEPERVVVYQPRPVYYYYPRAYPVYYYPYPSYYSFSWGYFWGVTTAFTIGWHSHNLHVYHPSYYGHPYYGHHYRDYWWYRSPSINVYNNYYVNNNVHADYRSRHGDTWRPRASTRLRYSDQRITRNRYYPNPATAGTARDASRTIQGAYSRSPDKRAAPVRTTPPSAERGTRSGGNDSVQRMRSALDAGNASRERTQGSLTREPRTNATGTEPGNVARMRSALEQGASRSRTATSGSQRSASGSTRTRGESATTVGEIRTALAAERERSVPVSRNATQSRQAVPERRSQASPRDITPRSPSYSSQRRTETTRPAPTSRSRSPEPSYRAAAPSRSSAPAPTASRPSAPTTRSRSPAPSYRAPAPSRSSAPAPQASRPSAPAARSAPAERGASGSSRESRSAPSRRTDSRR